MYSGASDPSAGPLSPASVPPECRGERAGRRSPGQKQKPDPTDRATGSSGYVDDHAPSLLITPADDKSHARIGVGASPSVR